MNNLEEEFTILQVTSNQQSSKYEFLWVLWAIFYKYGPKKSIWVFTDLMGFIGSV